MDAWFPGSGLAAMGRLDSLHSCMSSSKRMSGKMLVAGRCRARRRRRGWGM